MRENKQREVRDEWGSVGCSEGGHKEERDEWGSGEVGDDWTE